MSDPNRETSRELAAPRRDEVEQAQGTYESAEQVNELLRWGAACCNLIAPAPLCGELRELASVAVVALYPSLDHERGDIYRIGEDDDGAGGGFGLRATFLQRIARAAGVKWDPAQSGRIDSGRDPHYCAWRALAVYRDFDGSVITQPGSTELDLRDGGAEYERLRAVAERKGKDPAPSVRMRRAKIVPLCETMAMSRAIRKLGVRASYTWAELQRPFVVARLQLTGRTTDPEIRKMAAQAFLESMQGPSGAAALLYGAPEREIERPDPPPPPPTPKPSAPKPARVREAEAPRPAPAPPSPRAPAPAAPATTSRAPRVPAVPPPLAGRAEPGSSSPGRGRGPLTLPAKKGAPRVALHEAKREQLVYWRDRLARDLEAGACRYPGRDRELLEGIRLELGERAEAKRRDMPDAGDVGEFEEDQIPW